MCSCFVASRLKCCAVLVARMTKRPALLWIQCYHKIVLRYKGAIMLLLKIVAAGFLLSLLGTLAAWAMVYVEARRGNDTER